MKRQKLFGLVVLILAFTFTGTSAMLGPYGCASDGVLDEENSYEGNWDMHVGDCWVPPEPHTCTVCNYM